MSLAFTSAIIGCSTSQPFTAIPGEQPEAAEHRYLEWNARREGWAETRSGLEYRRLSAANPSGATAQPDSIVTVVCEGRFIDGRPFFATTKEKPLTGPLPRLIKGWQEGVLLMHAGETWEFVLPSELAYGAKGWTSPSASIPSIPPHTVLVFDIQLLDVAKPSEAAKGPPPH